MKLRSISRLSIWGFLAMAMFACQTNPEGLTIKGDIEGSENLQVFIDHVVIGKANTVLAREQINGNGQFTINLEDGVEPGIYNVRIGAKRVSIALEKGDTDKTISITGNLNTLQNYDVTIEGSPVSQELANTMQKLLARQMSAQEVATFIDQTEHPMMASYIAYRALGTSGKFLDTQRKAQAKLAEKYPNAEMTTEYAKFIEAAQQVYDREMATQRIREGAMAPDITLPGPDGKEYSLSDLRGQVVLLDFWASWCRPCRMENPNVVKVYNQYKDQGFTIFSVSLDGIDDRTAARLGADRVEEARERTRQAWIKAIEQDNLTWPYHVSDLKKWQSSAAGLYGVRSIPRAFMIDREGRIANTSVRGAAAIESALVELL